MAMVRCKRCKKEVPEWALIVDICLTCAEELAEQDREEPDGGAYREHQWT